MERLEHSAESQRKGDRKDVLCASLYTLHVSHATFYSASFLSLARQTDLVKKGFSIT